MVFLHGCSGRASHSSSEAFVYQISPFNENPVIDADWNKSFWINTESICLENYMGSYPEHFPDTKVRMRYNADYLYLIFRVSDQYVRAVAKKTNGKVWQDSCVEFFFTPGKESKNGYFNLETNCKGVLLMQYHDLKRHKEGFVDTADCAKIKIAYSLKENAEKEIREPVVWTLEYLIPVSILSKYMEVENPCTGRKWRANFYKCADSTSHPHWLTWAPVDNPTPKFHLPEFFGWLEFK